jgi:hypothetical protein
MSARTIIAEILARRHAEELAERDRMDRSWRVCAATAHRRIHVETCHRPECLDGGLCARMTALGLTDDGNPLPKRKRPLCGAQTRAGGECKVRVESGKRRCRFHGGKSTGPKTPEGRARIAEAQRRRWAAWREALSGA